MPDDNAPVCPECGTPMVQRLARRGPNAGRQFWGCGDFPRCRGVRPAQGEDGQTVRGTTNEDVPEPDTEAPMPLVVRAEPRHHGWQHTFYQSAALPAKLVDVLHREGVDRDLIRGFSQWRLDYQRGAAPPADQNERNVLSVAESLLTRGSVPFCPAVVEELLDVPSGEPGKAEAESALRTAIEKPSASFEPVLFDSDDERAFYAWLRQRIDGVTHVCVTPQIHLASIAPGIDPNSNQRADFLLTMWGVTPIVVEVDGAQHGGRPVQDHARDEALRAAGFTVVRVPVGEVRFATGPNLARLEALLPRDDVNLGGSGSWTRVAAYAKWLHQCEIALLRAVQSGWLQLGASWKVGVAFPDALGDDHKGLQAQAALEHLVELLARIARLHGRHFPPTTVKCVLLAPGTSLNKVDVLIAPADGSADYLMSQYEAPAFLVSDVWFPVEIAAPPSQATPVAAAEPDEEDARWFLSYLFRKPSFLEGQWLTISRTLRGQDSIVLLPTGAGKSIAFQLASLLLPGRCIVIDPIISLIEDQIDNLQHYGIDRCIGISSHLSTQGRERALDAVASGQYLFCYVAPERLQMRGFRDALRQLTSNVPVSAIVIDEAHCVSEWGHDFRTAYLNIGRISREYCESGGVIPPLVAATGTASRIVLKDVQRELGVTAFDAVITPKTFDRRELRFSILRCLSSEKRQRLVGFLRGLPARFGAGPNDFFNPRGTASQCGLIFCPHVNGEYGVNEQAQAVREALHTAVDVYSGKAPTGNDALRWEDQKRGAARRFKRNATTVLACTNAFGMGIDKPNIRYTAHLGLPRSIESFYQESGRAGRDRATAECCIVLSNDNQARSTRLLSATTPLEDIARVVRDTPWHEADDVIRALNFHVSAFRGEAPETRDIGAMVDKLLPPQ